MISYSDTRFSREKGFTLVELAIVMIIIGLLIGGVLKGQQLISNAKVTALVTQVKGYQAALNGFRDMFAALPGDMANAQLRLAGCSIAASSCQNGNGDGVLGTIAGSGTGNESWSSVPSGITEENTQFWKHMALADLISGVSPTASAPNWGESHPASALRGGFHARYAISPGTLGSMNGNIIVLRNGSNGAWTCGGGSSTGTCVVTPLQASQIDRKMDDGTAFSGYVQAVSASWSSGCGTANSGENGPSGYNEANKTLACDMMFKIDE